jgi:hypothetical protein
MVNRAETLFSPHELDAHHQFAVEPPEHLFHYTTLSGGYGILSSDTLWMSKVSYLNDTSELEIGIVKFRRLLDELLAGRPPDDERTLLEEVRSGLESFGSSNICVASFCEHGDLLSQWRWYGEGGRGLSIGVSSRVLRGLARGAINLWKCIYDDAAHHELLTAIAQRLLSAYRAERERRGGPPDAAGRHELLERFYPSFLQVAPIIKNPNFAEEREWRVVSLPIDPDDDSYGVSMTPGGRIIQRYELHFPRDPDGWCRAIPRVVVAPTKDPELIGEAIAVLCRKKKIACEAIVYSAIPFRHR